MGRQDVAEERVASALGGDGFFFAGGGGGGCLSCTVVGFGGGGGSPRSLLSSLITPFTPRTLSLFFLSCFFFVPSSL